MATTVPKWEAPPTIQKRAYLRSWALERSGGDAAKLPAIREARAEVRRNFGEGHGAGLGTDIIAQVLRELRGELTAKPAEAARGGSFDRLAAIARMMLDEGVSSLSVDSEGRLLEIRRFPQQS